MIRPQLAGRPGVLCRRVVIVNRQLKAIPEVLRAARVDMAHPSRLAVESAIRSLARTLEMLRRDVPAGIRECRDPGSVAALAESDTLAAHAVDEFVMWLDGDVLPHADGAWVMGADVYARWLTATTGDRTPLDQLRARAARELEMLSAPDTGAATERADSLRAAIADSMLEARASRGLRTVLGRRELAWGWAPFALRVRAMSRRASTAEAPRFTPSRLDLAATIAEIDLQTGAATFDEARERLERNAGLDSLAADREARVAALAPVRAAATVTTWQLEDLRSEVASGLGTRFQPQAFLTAVIHEGAVPVVAFRETVLRRLRAASAAPRTP